MKIFYAFYLFALPIQGFSQGIFLEPSPYNAEEVTRVYVDITSEICSCPELQDAHPENNPLYIWTWYPSEFRAPEVVNGTWDESNENLRMFPVDSNPNLWYYDFYNLTLPDFYSVSGNDFTYLCFLLKEVSGAPVNGAEQKSNDICLDLFTEQLLSTTDGAELEPIVKIWPNPASNELWATWKNVSGSASAMQIKILDLQGKEVLVADPNWPANKPFQLSLAEISSGMYFVNFVTQGKSIHREKLLVK